MAKSVNLRRKLGVDVTVSLWSVGDSVELLIQKPSGQERVSLKAHDFVRDCPEKRKLEG